jgi:hypothetical protein
MRARDAAWTPFPSSLSSVPDGLRKALPPPPKSNPEPPRMGENGEGCGHGCVCFVRIVVFSGVEGHFGFILDGRELGPIVATLEKK